MLSNDCAREPIHIIGEIQPHGFLVAVSEPDFLVRHVSENLAQFVSGVSYSVIGRPLAELFGETLVERISSDPSEDGFVTINPIRLMLGVDQAIAHDGVIHRYNDMLLLEVEPRLGAYSVGRPLNLAKYLQNPIARIAGQISVPEIAQIAAIEFQKITGYDRVMIYQFDPDWNGQVIAEAGTTRPSFLGYHFPATDIPEQARRLFLVNPLRSIVDIDAAPARITPERDARTGSALDLSRSLLRSASQTHIQYLRNMGVQSSLTISLLIRGKLWGMLTAHHGVSHRLDFLTRSVCELFGQTLSAHILARTDNAMLEERIKSRARVESYMISVEHSALNPQSGPFDSVALLGLLHATGAVSLIDGVYSQSGVTIDRDQLMAITAVLRRQSIHGIACSHRLSDIDPAAARFASYASGALFISLSESTDDFILLLREEVIRTRTWAGNPTKNMLRSEGSLSPRISFDAWEESVRGSSPIWTDLEIEKAQLLREQFRNTRLRQHLHARELTYEQQRARSTVFQEAILPPALPTVRDCHLTPSTIPAEATIRSGEIGMTPCG